MKLSHSIAAFAVCAPAAAVAQEATPPANEVVVTGRGLETPAEATVAVVEIDRERILSEASHRLETLLADAAGLQQFRRADSRSAHPTAQGLSLRGIGGNASSRALLILDGVPQADPFGGWVAFPAYATERLGRIRVTRGGGSGFWGSGALAGTVELESATPDQLSPLTGSIAYGSRDSVEAKGSATLVRGSGFATVSGAYARGDGFVPTVAEDRGPADRAAPYEQASGAIRAGVAIAPETEVQVNVSAFTDRRERGTAFTDNSSEGADASVRLVGRGRWGWSALGYVQTRAFASSFASVDATRTTATQSLDQYNVPATGIGARFEVAPPVGKGVSLRLGGDVRALEGRTQERYTFVAGSPTRRRETGGRTQTLGLFADGSAQLGDLTLSLGGRVDWWRIEDGHLDERALSGGAALTDTRFADRDGSEATGRAGIAWQASDAIALRAAAYRGWRLPTLNELYRPFRVGPDATAANPDLAPEQLTGAEGGVTLTPLPGMQLSGTFFWNRLEDAIANVTEGRGPGNFPGVGFVSAAGVYRVRRNLDAIESKGFELDASYRPGPFGARVSWSHTDPRVEASGSAAALDGLRPAQTPRDLVSATLDWREGGWGAALTLRHAARQFEDDANEEALAPATTVDAFFAAPIRAGFSLELRGENLLNERVETGISGADVVERASPRTLWVGLRYRG